MKKTSRVLMKALALALTLCLLFGAVPVVSVSAADGYSLTFSCNTELGLIRELNNRTSANAGDEVQIFIAPEELEGYIVESLTVTDTTNNRAVSYRLRGNMMGGVVYIFTMPSGNVSVEAVIAADTANGYHLIHATYSHGTAKVQVKNTGSIGRSTILAREGDTIRIFSQTPDEGYLLKDESYYQTAYGYKKNLADGEAFTMPGCDVNLNVIFTRVYDISIAVIGGTAFASYSPPFVTNATAVTQAAENESFYLHMNNDDDHNTNRTLRVVTASGVQLEASKDGSYRMPAEPISVSLTYYKNMYDLTYSAEHGTVSGVASALPFRTVSLNCEPDTGYLLQELYYTYTPYAGMDEVKTNIDVNGELSFEMPDADVEVTAVFAKGRTVEWLNGDDNILDIKTYAEGNPEPTTDKIPVKASTWECSYVFAGWSAPAYYTGGLTVYRPIWDKYYDISVGGGTADCTRAKAGTTVTLTPGEAPEGMYVAGWRVEEGDFTVTGNTFVMPASHVTLSAIYAIKQAVSLSLDFNDDTNGVYYAGKPLSLSGTVSKDGSVLNVGGTVTITFSSGSPSVEGAVSYELPVTNGRYSIDLEKLPAAGGNVFAAYSGEGVYNEAMVMKRITLYTVAAAWLEGEYTTPAVKTVYNYGEPLNTDNLTLWVYWSDASVETLPVTPDMVSGFDGNRAGAQTLTVSCPYPTDDELTYEITLNGVPVGDVTGDGQVNINDVTAIQRHLAGLELIPEARLAFADTNGDGHININDATVLQEYLAGYPIVLGQHKA